MTSRVKASSSTLTSDALGLHWSPGPGDTLRFVHALRQLRSKHPWTRCIVLTRWLSLDRFAGVWSGTVRKKDHESIRYWTVLHDGSVTWVARTPWGIQNWDEKRTWLTVYEPRCIAESSAEAAEQWAHLLLKTTNVPRCTFVHPYVWKESPNVMYTPISFASTDRLRIDRNSTLSSSVFNPAPYAVRPKPWTVPWRVACVLRKEKKEPFRNTPDWLPTLVWRLANRAGMEVGFWGADPPADLGGPSHTKKMRLPYVEQMRFLAANFDCAIGVNSGGLDLAAAAGVPVLRVAEFQRRGYKAPNTGKRPPEQAMDLRQPYTLPQFLLNEIAVLFAPFASLARSPRSRRLERRQQRQESFVVEGVDPLALDEADVFGGADVAPCRLRVDPHRPRDGLHAASAQPLSDDLSDLDHRDLSKRHRSSSAVGRLGRGQLGHASWRNFCRPEGGILVKSPPPERGECS